MFNMESRHLLTLSVQNALDCISENFNPKIFLEEHAPDTPQESAPSQSPLYTISLGSLYHEILRPPLVLIRNAIRRGV